MSDAQPTAPLRGSCLCGGVVYETTGPFELVARCHCIQCRKASGAEFATNATVPASGFRIVEGEALVQRFESSPGQYRCFCGRCGSPLWKRFDEDTDKVRLRLGLLDDRFDQAVQFRAFTGEAMAVTEIPEPGEGEFSFEGRPGA